MTNLLSRIAAVASLCGALLVVGCGGTDYPDTVAAEGTVLYKGKPVEGANVSFFTEGAPRAGYAVTDAEGKFVLNTFGARDGAIPGDHVVTVSKAGEQQDMTTPAQPPKPEDMMKTYQAQIGKKPENKLPAKYADKKTSPLKVTVTADAPNNFTLELTD